MKHTIAVFVKNLTSGGAEKQSVLLARSLSQDYKVHYVIFNVDKVHQKYFDLLHEDRKIQVKGFHGGHYSRFRQLIHYLKEQQVDVIFSYLTAANFYACMAGAIAGSKVVTGLRNAELPLCRRIADRWLTNQWARIAVANCYSGKTKFISQGFKDGRIIVIPNCFENIRPYSEKHPNKIVRVITVGRFVAQKDYETAIRVISLMKEKGAPIAFDIVGYGTLERDVRKWVEKYGVGDITSIHINPDNIPELLDGADIYLSTSLFEGTSNSIMEAMNADLPIVCTDVGDNSYLVTSANGFLAEKKDVQSLAAFLLLLVNDKSLRAKMGKASKQLILENYSMEIFRERYVHLLTAILSES